MTQFAKNQQEYKDLSSLITVYHKYKEVGAAIDNAKVMLLDVDDEIKAMAQKN